MTCRPRPRTQNLSSRTPQSQLTKAKDNTENKLLRAALANPSEVEMKALSVTPYGNMAQRGYFVTEGSMLWANVGGLSWGVLSVDPADERRQPRLIQEGRDRK